MLSVGTRFAMMRTGPTSSWEFGLSQLSRRGSSSRFRTASSAVSSREYPQRQQLAARLPDTHRNLGGLRWSGEFLSLGLVLSVALLIRLIGISVLPAFLFADEASQLSAVYRAIASYGPGLFGLDWKRDPALDMYLTAPFVALFDMTPAASRLPSVLVSMLGLVPLYLVSRRYLSRVASTCATALLAYNAWYLAVSRYGLDTGWAVFITGMALLHLEYAAESKARRDWLLCGVWCALALYGPFPCRLTIVIVCVQIALLIARSPQQGLAKQRKERVFAASSGATLTTRSVAQPHIPVPQPGATDPTADMSSPSRPAEAGERMLADGGEQRKTIPPDVPSARLVASGNEQPIADEPGTEPVPPPVAPPLERTHEVGRPPRQRRRREDRMLLRGLITVLAVAFVLYLPQVPSTLGTAADSITQSPRRALDSLPRGTGTTFVPALIAGDTLESIGVAPRGWPLLDYATLLLAVAGMLFGLQRAQRYSLWYLALLVPLLLIPMETGNPASHPWGMALVLPMYLFVGLALDMLPTLLSQRLQLGPKRLVFTLTAILCVGNVVLYGAWASAPSTATSDGAVLPMTRFEEWRQVTRAAAASGQPGPQLAGFIASEPAPIAAPIRGTSTVRPVAPRIAQNQGSTARPLTQGEPVMKATFVRFLSGSGTDIFLEARGVAVDLQGNVYVADAAAHKVLRFDGTGKALPPVALSTEKPAQPWDLAAAPDGTVVATEAESGSIWRIAADGRATQIGDMHFFRPRGITVAPDGSIYVAETGGNRVVKLSPDGQRITSFEARPPQQKALPLLSQPTDVALDSDGNLLITEPDAKRLEKLTGGGTPVALWELNSGDTITGPHITQLPGNLIAVTVPIDHHVIIVNQQGSIVGVVGSQGTADGQFGAPVGIAVDATGTTLYVADTELQRVAIFSLTR